MLIFHKSVYKNTKIDQKCPLRGGPEKPTYGKLPEIRGFRDLQIPNSGRSFFALESSPLCLDSCFNETSDARPSGANRFSPFDLELDLPKADLAQSECSNGNLLGTLLQC